MIAGALLAFVLSIDDFVITSFTGGATVTFPLWIYGSTRTGTPPQVNVMGALIFLVGILIAVAAQRPRVPLTGRGPIRGRRSIGRLVLGTEDER